MIEKKITQHIHTFSSILIVDSYRSLQLLSSSFSNFHLLPDQNPMSETTFLIPSDRSPIDKSRRVIEKNVEGNIEYIVTFKGSYFYFTIISTFPRLYEEPKEETRSLPVPSVFSREPHTTDDFETFRP